MDKERILDMVVLLGIVILLITGIFFITYYFQGKTNSCTSSPFVFGAQQLEERYDLEVSGTIYFLTKTNQHAPPLHFNSTTVYQLS